MKPTVAVVVLCLLPWVQPTAAAAPCVDSWALPVGAVAPCSGLLVPEADARMALHCVGIGLPQCEADRAYETTACEARHRGSIAQLEASVGHAAVLQAGLDDLLRIDARPWWDSRSVWVGVGVVLGAGAVFGVMDAIDPR